MIVGIGTDLVEIGRMQKLFNQYQNKFSNKILSPTERKEFKTIVNKPAFLAKRFAAKEALAKALGSGIKGFWFSDIEITHDASGQPGFNFFKGCLVKVKANKISQAYLSITDEKQYALAFVVLETD